MKPRSTLLLLGIFAALAAYIYLVERHQKSTKELAENKDRAGADSQAEKIRRLRTSRSERRRDQMAQCRCETNVIEPGKRKSDGKDAADNPKPPFELKLRRAQEEQCRRKSRLHAVSEKAFGSSEPCNLVTL